MADGTHIEWTDATWNPITGCSVHSAGCTNCYAMRLAGTRLRDHRSRAGLTKDTKAGPVWTGEVRFNEQWLDQPLRWKRPRRVFVCAHADLFHENVPDEWIDRVFAVMALAPQHQFQVLTKRAERMAVYVTKLVSGERSIWQEAKNAGLPAVKIAALIDDLGWSRFEHRLRKPLPNVWLGVSVEDQRAYDERSEHLKNTPAAIRWISFEPLLGAIECGDLSWLHWAVGGGESGPGARPVHPSAFRSLRDQCAAAGVPYLHKQNGHYVEVSAEQHHEDYAAACRGDGPWRGDRVVDVDGTVLPGDSMCIGSSRVYMRPVGKKAAGRLLDGVEHNGFPEVNQ